MSARLDNEEQPGEGAEVDSHLASCANCRTFAEQAAKVTRLARTELVGPVPDLAEALAGTLAETGYRPGRFRWIAALRALLAAVGLGQLGLATADLLVAAEHDHGTGGLSGASLAHLAHESSAWNLALAVGFLGVAARPSRLRGVLPLVGAFVGVLAALSVLDLASGRVEGPRLLSHGLVVLGLLALLGLARACARPSDDAPGAVAFDHRSARPSLPRRPLRRRARSGPDGDHDLKPSAHRPAA